MDSKKILEIKQAIAVDSPNGYSVKNKDVHELIGDNNNLSGALQNLVDWYMDSPKSNNDDEEILKLDKLVGIAYRVLKELK